jgi:hypothetical protein
LERKLALEEHELLIHLWEKVKAVMSTLEEGGNEYESFKTMESELRSQMVAAVVFRAAVPADPQAFASASSGSALASASFGLVSSKCADRKYPFKYPYERTPRG